METQTILENGELEWIIKNLREELRGKQFSDVVDEENNQYVDLVMEGGGVLGVGLLGYLYVLEQMKIRFLGIGGASAGSIVALLLAAVGRPEEAKSRKLLEILIKKNFSEFVDGDEAIVALLKSKKTGLTKWGKLVALNRGLKLIKYFFKNWGLNPGDNFYNWIKQCLSDNGIEIAEHLEKNLRPPQTLKRINTTGATRQTIFQDARLAIIAADITSDCQVEFPRMAGNYYVNPSYVNPADFVRASMSIPAFFHPHKIPNPNYSNEYTPKEFLFMDGGIVSNFPINIFHLEDRVPANPTFGVKLGISNKYAKINNVIDVGWATFNAARHSMDRDFLNKNQDYKHLVCEINTAEINWLNFDLTDKDKLELFLSGARSAANFLRSFNWENYKNLRRDLLKAKERFNQSNDVSRP